MENDSEVDPAEEILKQLEKLPRLTKLGSIKRKDFFDRADYLHARQIRQLVALALKSGATVEEAKAVLEKEDGGWSDWDWLWEGGKP